MVISCLYVQTVIRQCFCFPNSQWGATAHLLDTPSGEKTHSLLSLANFDFAHLPDAEVMG